MSNSTSSSPCHSGVTCTWQPLPPQTHANSGRARPPKWAGAVFEMFGARRWFWGNASIRVVGVITAPQILIAVLSHAGTAPPSSHPCRRPALIFKTISATSNANIQASLRYQIAHRRLTRQLNRMPKWCDNGARPQANVFRLLCQIRQNQKRLGDTVKPMP